MGPITIQYDERGELVWVDLGRGKITEPTHNLYEKVPPGVYKGHTDLGRLLTYKQDDGTLMRCQKKNCKIY